MKTTAIEVDPIAVAAPIAKSRLRVKLAAYVELTKPRITSLIMLTAAAGFALGSQGRTNYLVADARDDRDRLAGIRDSAL